MKRLHAFTFLIAAALMAIAPALGHAVEPDEMLSNPKLEARARAISQELRCMVCQNESIDESQAPLAHDLRVLVRQRIMAGDSDAEVLSFLVSRYGEFVLLKPPLSWHTVALWGMPPTVLLIGIGLIAIVERRRGTALVAGGTPPLSPGEQARVAQILQGENNP